MNQTINPVAPHDTAADFARAGIVFRLSAPPQGPKGRPDLLEALRAAIDRRKDLIRAGGRCPAEDLDLPAVLGATELQTGLQRECPLCVIARRRVAEEVFATATPPPASAPSPRVPRRAAPPVVSPAAPLATPSAYMTALQDLRDSSGLAPVFTVKGAEGVYEVLTTTRPDLVERYREATRALAKTTPASELLKVAMRMEVKCG